MRRDEIGSDTLEGYFPSGRENRPLVVELLEVPKYIMKSIFCESVCVAVEGRHEDPKPEESKPGNDETTRQRDNEKLKN